MEISDILIDIAGIVSEETTEIMNLEFDGELRPTLIHPRFLLIGYEPDKFYISMNINNASHSETAHYTLLVTLYLYDKVYIYPDFFYNKEKKSFVFGEAASDLFKEHVRNKNGMKVCNVCERTLPKSLIDDEKGYCKICEEITLPNATFH